ncbi:MAG: hypothetical protein IPK81_24710 [Rhodospirillales bacterium]|nr:MAG: hypothetical protein IPK81_24710 [Rhodospirillales bacterium]
MSRAQRRRAARLGAPVEKPRPTGGITLPPKRWSVAQAAGYGTLAGAPLLAVRDMMRGVPIPTETAALLGYAAGGAVIGAFLFMVVALTRNAFVK